MTIGEAHVGMAQHVDVARWINGTRFDQHVRRFPTVRPGVHTQRTAN